MTPVKFIREQQDHVETLMEAVGDKKYLYIEGVYLQSEVKNRNGRLYPKGVMESAVNDYAPLIETCHAFGELGHPDGPKINEKHISHRIMQLEWHGNNVNGKAVVNPYGDGAVVYGIYETGGRLGVSSRGLGSLKNKSGLMEVQADFKLATAADIVTNPSAPDAFVNGIMEGADWIHNGSDWVKLTVEQSQKTIREATRTNMEETKLAVFQKFIDRLRG